MYSPGVSLREKCPDSELIWFVFCRMRENADQNNSEYGHFLRKVCSNELFHKVIFLIVLVAEKNKN